MPTKYVFRGIVQEADSKLTLFPYGDLGIAFYSGEGAHQERVGEFRRLECLADGVVGSRRSGKTSCTTRRISTRRSTSGSAAAFSLATTYTAYTSPNGMFGTVQELMFKVSQASKLAPYAILAFELDGQADGGSGEGVYLELGAAPSWPLAGGKVTFAVPVKFGFSLSDYYEDPATGEDSKFGYFQVGGLFTLPFTSADEQVRRVEPPRRGGLLRLRRHDAGLQQRRRQKVVASFGIGVVY